MTAIYDNHQLTFMYPENWVLTESQETEDFVDISLESPENSIWSVGIFRPDSQPADLLDSCVEALQEQYEDLEVVEFQGELGEYQAVGFDAHFYCLDFLVTAKARVFVTQRRTFNVFCQAESRQFDQSQSVFDAITLSLLNSVQ